MESPISIEDTIQDRAFWLGQGLARESFAEVSAADLLIVPLKDFREGIPFAFHLDTAALARFLSTGLAGKVKVEVLADEDEYLEIALHGAVFRFSPIIVKAVIGPLVLGLITNYLYDVLKAKPGDSVEMSLVLEDRKCRTLKVDFKGDAKDFNLMADKVGQLSRDCVAAGGTFGMHLADEPELPASGSAAAPVHSTASSSK